MELLETDKAYLAGLIDGDGCITIRKGTNNFLPIIHVVGVIKGPIEFFAEKVGVKTVYCPSNRMYQGFIGGDRAKELAKDILPYLKGKTKQATLILRFPISKMGSWRLSEEQKLQRALLYLEMKKLNKEGKSRGLT